MSLIQWSSVPTPSAPVKLVDPAPLVVRYCVECWQEAPRVEVCFGRELCPSCAKAEEDAYCECNAPSEYDSWTVQSDRMDKLSDILAGMNFS